MTSILLASLLASLTQVISGEIPPGLTAPARVIFVTADDSPGDVRCDEHARRWSCAGVTPGVRGLVVFVGDDGVASISIGMPDVDVPVSRWGRVVRVTAGGAAPDDLHDLHMSAWKPERSRARPNTRRFRPVADDDVHVAPMSPSSFWIAGTTTDPDAFVLLEGPAVGTTRLAASRLSEGPPDEPLYLPAAVPLTIVGRVHGSHGEDADGADVELFALLAPDDPAVVRARDDVPLLHRLSAKASADGRFRIERAPDAPLLIAAAHTVFGAGGVWISSAAVPVDVELTPPALVKGRVLKHRLPVPAARVRFVPDADAWASSTDPADHISEETFTASDGTFALPLPPKRVGVIRVLLDDGTGVRVAVPSLVIQGDVLVGDLTVPDARRLFVRLADGPGCSIVAAGPVGALGLEIVKAASATTVYELELPDAGVWSLNAECGGEIYEVEPPLVAVPAEGHPSAVDARVLKPAGDS